MAAGLRIVGRAGADAYGRPGVGCGSHLNFNARDHTTLKGKTR
jgi:hypothetical protein